MFAHLLEIQRRYGREHFPLIDQAFYPNHREMVSRLSFRGFFCTGALTQRNGPVTIISGRDVDHAVGLCLDSPTLGMFSFGMGRVRMRQDRPAASIRQNETPRKKTRPLVYFRLHARGRDFGRCN